MPHVVVFVIQLLKKNKLDVETMIIELESLEVQHQKCNINYFNNRFVPVVFHNLRGYDSHFIIKKAYDISNKLNNPKFDVIPNSSEKFMSFNIGNLKFIDSLQFMASSLEKLVENLYEKDDKYMNFSHMKKEYNNEIDMLCRKGFYPYEWMDSKN